MTPRFCQNDDGDCPCSDFSEGWHDNEGQCKLGPPQYCGEDEAGNSYWGFPGINRDSWCYQGRQIMEQQATWQALKNCYPKEGTENEEGRIE